MPKQKKKTTTPSPFEKLARALVSVPKSEVDKKAKDYDRRKQREKEKRRTA